MSNCAVCLFSRQTFPTMDFADAIAIAKQLQGGTCIPGVSMMDVMSTGGIHLIQNVARLADSTFQQRVAHWKAQTATKKKTLGLLRP
jgi:hypothetical protein